MKGQPGQIVAGYHQPIIRIKGNTCSVIREDYFAPETCDGDFNKRVYDGCDFPISLLAGALVLARTRGKVGLSGRAIFSELFHEWGTDYEEYKHEVIHEEDFRLLLEISKFRQNITLTVLKDRQVYAKVKESVRTISQQLSEMP